MTADAAPKPSGADVAQASSEADREVFLDAAARSAASDPVEVPIRQLLAFWGARRRGFWIVNRIESDLADRKLETRPPLSDGHIDGLVEIRGIGAKQTAGADERHPEEPSDGAPRVAEQSVALRVDQIRAATAGVRSINPQDSLSTAQSLMMRYDYSQLPVISPPRTVKGAVSWESISVALMRNPSANLSDAMTPEPREVRFDHGLLGIVPAVVDAGFVLVRNRENLVTGIITPADLSEKFVELANPFLMIGEIERLLRTVIDQHFSQDELQAIRTQSDGNRTVERADDLNFGEYKMLLEQPDNWSRLGWGLDRAVFIEALDEVRIIRNGVVHFSPDPIEGLELNNLRLFIGWLRLFAPSVGGARAPG